MILWNYTRFWELLKTGGSLQCFLDLFSVCVIFYGWNRSHHLGEYLFWNMFQASNELHIQESTLLDVSQNVHPRSSTVRPWKWMVGRWFSFSKRWFSGSTFNFQGVPTWNVTFLLGLIGASWAFMVPNSGYFAHWATQLHMDSQRKNTELQRICWYFLVVTLLMAEILHHQGWWLSHC